MGLVKAYLRYDRPKKYEPLLLIVDEAHLLVSEDTMAVVIEGRKYKIGAIFATAGFSTVPDGVRRALLNVGTVVTFQCGHREAKYFGNELRMDAKELQTLFGTVTAVIEPKLMPKKPNPNTANVLSDGN